MIEELDMHLMDLVQNAYASGASRIDVKLVCDDAEQLVMQVADNGKGMDERTLEAVQRGYFSSKSPESVGLGIPLLRETAEHCNGRFRIESRPDTGTTVLAEFQRNHIDRPPFGDLASTFLNILVTAGARYVRITYRCDEDELEIDTEALSDLLGELPLQHPDVIRFLRAYIDERIHRE
jgi:anti-sigma regulatory factor (Ser/Thr protein kinase)